jgi:hypothetical protein
MFSTSVGSQNLSYMTEGESMFGGLLAVFSSWLPTQMAPVVAIGRILV